MPISIRMQEGQKKQDGGLEPLLAAMNAVLIGQKREITV